MRNSIGLMPLNYDFFMLLNLRELLNYIEKNSRLFHAFGQHQNYFSQILYQ